jgi:hypothetical protein
MQFILARTDQTPMGCECDFCDPGLTFLCEECQREQPYCLGQADEFFELCTNCYAALPEGIKDPAITTENQGEPSGH